MCGIGAFQIVGGECDPGKVARVLLRLLESRGKDAAGVAWHCDGDTYITKNNVSGKVLAKQLQRNIGTTGIVHTRWATQGSPKVEHNNHPIDAHGVVGVHNGHISNDNELFKMVTGYKRQGEVDSEAVFALIAHGPKEMTLKQRLAEVRGGAALLWLRTADSKQRLHAARLTSSPLWFGQTAKGSVIFASTEHILKETAKRCELEFAYIHEMEVGSYVRVEAGVVGEMQKVKVQHAYYAPRHNYALPSTYSTAATRQSLPKPQSETDEQTLMDLLEAEEYEWTLRDSLDRQFGFGRWNY